MSLIFKVLAGLILVIVGIYWYFPSAPSFTSLRNYQSLLFLLQGTIGVVVFLAGLFILWLETDEIKVRLEERRKRRKEEIEGIKEGLEIKGKVEEGKFKCSHCGREFGSERGLKIHMRREHYQKR